VWGGRTRHIETRQYYLRELKEQGVISVIWKAGSKISSDMYTHNLGRREFEKHAAEYVGNDEYMQTRIKHLGRVSKESFRAIVPLPPMS
jgi:hypothetical protein